MEHPTLRALGHQGSEHFAGLETFDNPGVRTVHMETDEFTCNCPVTGQPDFYKVEIAYEDSELCIESKSLKLYLHQYRDQGHFCEALAVQIKADVKEALEAEGDMIDERDIAVTLTQVPRGGISIEATA